MIITCEECGVKFNLNEAILKPEGSKVRCSKCKHIFVAYPPLAVEPHEPKEADMAKPEAEQRVADMKQLPEEPDLHLQVEKETETGFQTEESEIESMDEELDLSGLDDMLSTKEEAHDREEELELDLDLDSDDEGEVDSLEMETGEVDFSELDSILESDEKTSVKKDTGDLELDLKLEDDDGTSSLQAEEPALEEDLDLDLDLDLELESQDKREAPGEELELELELDLEKEAGTGESQELELDIDEDINALDIQKASKEISGQETIEQDLLATKSLADSGEEGSDDLELDLDIDESSGAQDEELEAAEEEIDLSELEQTLEMELLSPKDETDEEPENVELELADDQEELAVEMDTVSDDEIDVSDIEEMLDLGEESEAGEKASSDDLELEFDIDSGSGSAQTENSPQMLKAAESFEEGMEEDTAAEVEKDKATPLPEEKKRGKAITVVAVVVILLTALAGAYYLLSSQGILPSLSFMQTTEQDMGKVEAVQSSIKSDFINNDTIGKLFVITGQVRNSSKKTHHSIQVQANLYSKGKTLSKTISAYCGNVLSNEELVSINQETLEKRLTNQFTADNQYIKLPAGSEMPFMIVIPNLPDDLEEYKIIVSDSKAE